MNGFSSTVSTTSSQPSSTGLYTIQKKPLEAALEAILLTCPFFLGNHHTPSTGTTSTSTIPLSHSNNSNNNNMNSSNLNLTATHNGFGINHSMINNQTHSTNHFNSTQSTLTYRSNRRSTDRSDNNKIGELISTPSSSSSTSSSSSSAAAAQMRNAALQYNDPIHEYDASHPRSYFNMCLHVIYKMLMFIYCGFGKRRPTSLNNATNARMPESMFSRFLCALKYRAIGNGANGFVGNSGGNMISGDSAGNYVRNVSNDNENEQIGYIERIDDESMENHSDLHANAKLATSFASHAPITIELPNAGKCVIFALVLTLDVE